MSFLGALSSSSLSTAVALLAVVVVPVALSLHIIGCAKKKVSRETATTTTASRSTDGSKKVIARQTPKPDKEPTPASNSARSQKPHKDQKCQKDPKKPAVDNASLLKQHSTEDTDLRSIQNVPRPDPDAPKNPAGAKAGGELAPTQTPTVPLPPQSAYANPDEANAAGMSRFVMTAAKPVKPDEAVKHAPKESSNKGSKKGSKEPSRAEPAKDQAGGENQSKKTAADAALPARHSKTASDEHEVKSAEGKNTKNSSQKKSTTTNAANQVLSPEGRTKYTNPAHEVVTS